MVPQSAPEPPASAYFMEDRHDPEETHTLAVLVDNEPGVLARVIGLFSGRGYNIESLTVSETQHEQHLSRITIVTTGTRAVLEQIRNQLDRLVSVHRVTDLTMLEQRLRHEKPLERELALVKVNAEPGQRAELMQLIEIFRGRVIDVSERTFVVEVTGSGDKIDAFEKQMEGFGVRELVRTGRIAMMRGPRTV